MGLVQSYPLLTWIPVALSTAHAGNPTQGLAHYPPNTQNAYQILLSLA